MQGQDPQQLANMARAELARRAQVEIVRRRGVSQGGSPKQMVNSDFMDSIARGGLQNALNLGSGVETGIEKGIGALGIPGLQYQGGIRAPDLVGGASDPGIAKTSEFLSAFMNPIGKPFQGLNALSKLPALAGKLAPMADLMANGAAYGAVDTFARGQDQNLGSNTTASALFPVMLSRVFNIPITAAEGLARGIVGGVDKASQRTGSGVKTPQQLAQILPDLQGVPVPLHEATNSGFLRGTANQFGSIPFSGVTNPAQTAVHLTDELANNVLKHIGGDINPAEANPFVHQKVEESKKNQEKISEGHYNRLGEEADKSGISADITNIQNHANELMENYHDFTKSKKAEKGTHPLEPEKTIRYFLDAITRGFIPDMSKEGIIGKEAPVNTVMDMVKAQQMLGKYYGKLKGKEGKETQFGIVKDLYHDIGADLDSVIDRSGNKRLGELLTTAKQNHIENVLPYRDKGIDKLIKGVPTSDIAKVLLNNSTKGSSIIPHLDDETRSVIFSQWLKPAVDAQVEIKAGEDPVLNTTPHKLLERAKFLNRENPVAYDELVSPEHQRSLGMLSNLHEATRGLRTIANPPKTGAALKPFFYGTTLEGMLGGLGMVAGLHALPAALVGPAAAATNHAFHGMLRTPKTLEAYAAGKGAKRAEAINSIFSGKKSNAIRKVAKIASNPAMLANILSNNNGDQ